MKTFTLGCMSREGFDFFKVVAEARLPVALTLERGIVQVSLMGRDDYDAIAWFFDGFILRGSM